MMPERRRVYLDNAATTWPKPQSVYDAVEKYMRENGASAGRGVYGDAQEATRIISSARRRIATLLGAREPHRIIFTSNGTDSLNLAPAWSTRSWQSCRHHGC